MSPMRSSPRGSSLIESVIAMSVVLVGLMGFATLQISTARAGGESRRGTMAAAIGQDMLENMKQWSYTDTRLNPRATVTSLDDKEIKDRWDMGRDTSAPVKQQFSDATTDANATSADALGSYRGISADVDLDGNRDFIRYWTVTAIDLGGTGTPNGKLIQVTVRWKEPGAGFKQHTVSTFRANPQAMLK
jgi:type IV pilus modification protein PilV